ncbi:MAG: tetratricopeptide repeat protein [Bacteroidales bacterium]|nr:tetratricopeptide repeat protein [Bacteroidales bacterium]
MKRFILAVAALFTAATMMSAQDMAEATELYNNGATALTTKNYTEALDCFQKALEMGQAIGADAEELVANCKNAIPGISLQIAKEFIKDSKYTEAAAQLDAAAKIAAEFENEDVAAEAVKLVPDMWMKKGKEDLKIKDFAEAAASFEKAYAADTTDGKTAVTLGQVYGTLGKTEQALEIYQHAIWNGEEEAANSQISKLFIKEANAALKGNKLANAVASAEKAMEYAEDPTAYLIAGQASQKLNKNADAISFFEKYLELKPDASNANAIIFTVGALYQGAKNNAKALEFYKKVENDAKFGAQAKQMITALGK